LLKGEKVSAKGGKEELTLARRKPRTGPEEKGIESEGEREGGPVFRRRSGERSFRACGGKGKPFRKVKRAPKAPEKKTGRGGRRRGGKEKKAATCRGSQLEKERNVKRTSHKKNST